MKKMLLFVIIVVHCLSALSQKADPWKIVVEKINPSNYYGETVANGVIGIVSSAEPLRCKDVVLNGA